MDKTCCRVEPPVFTSLPWAAIVVAFLAAFLVAQAIARTTRLHGRLTLDDATGVQKVHTRPTPRVGGLAVALGMLLAWPFLPADVAGFWGLLLLALAPAFVAGIIEDITRAVRPRWRLLATLVSGLVFWWLTGYGIDRLGWGPLNWIQSVPPIVAALTMFGFGATANATNLIDGFHGLATASVFFMAAGLAGIAWTVGDGEILAATGILMGAVAGFFFVNYPSGRIFLGDAGAYGLGAACAALGIALVAKHAEVSPWALLVCFGYPAIETGFSIWRRARRGLPTTQPDGVHFHKLVWRAMARPVARQMGRPAMANALTLYFLWPLAAIGPLAAALFHHRTLAALGGLVVVLAVYLVIYRVVSLQHIHARLKKKARASSLPGPDSHIALDITADTGRLP